MRSTKPADTIPLRGGHVALDFANTAGWHASEEPKEWLHEYAEVARWAQHVGVLSVDEAAQATTLAGTSPRIATREVHALHALRETLFRVCRAIIAAATPNAADLASLNDARANAAAHQTFVVDDGIVRLAWRAEPLALDAPRHRLAIAIADLLTSADVARVRECDGHQCGWLFIDRSRNGTRRWCASEECGNRERVRKHLASRAAR